MKKIKLLLFFTLWSGIQCEVELSPNKLNHLLENVFAGEFAKDECTKIYIGKFKPNLQILSDLNPVIAFDEIPEEKFRCCG